MRKVSVLFGVIVFALSTGSLSFAQGHAKPMTNDDVVAMVKAELPEATIVSAIHAQETNFDPSASALLNLKKQGVSYKIIDAMLAAPGQHRDSAAAPPVAVGENAAPPAPGGSKPTAATQVRASAAGQPNPSTPSPVHHTGFFGRLHQIQDQVNGSMQQAQGGVQQAQGTVQGTVQQAQGTVQQAEGAVSLQGNPSSAPAQTAGPATTPVTSNAAAATSAGRSRRRRPAATTPVTSNAAATTPVTSNAAATGAGAWQGQQSQVTQQTTAAQRQLAARQAQASRAACKQQAVKAYPEGGLNLVKAYMACSQQAKAKLQAK